MEEIISNQAVVATMGVVVGFVFKKFIKVNQHVNQMITANNVGAAVIASLFGTILLATVFLCQ